MQMKFFILYYVIALQYINTNEYNNLKENKISLENYYQSGEFSATKTANLKCLPNKSNIATSIHIIKSSIGEEDNNNNNYNYMVKNYILQKCEGTANCTISFKEISSKFNNIDNFKNYNIIYECLSSKLISSPYNGPLVISTLNKVDEKSPAVISLSKRNSLLEYYNKDNFTNNNNMLNFKLLNSFLILENVDGNCEEQIIDGNLNFSKKKYDYLKECKEDVDCNFVICNNNNNNQCKKCGDKSYKTLIDMPGTDIYVAGDSLLKGSNKKEFDIRFNIVMYCEETDIIKEMSNVKTIKEAVENCRTLPACDYFIMSSGLGIDKQRRFTNHLWLCKHKSSSPYIKMERVKGWISAYRSGIDNSFTNNSV